MKRYQNKSRHSGVEAFEIGPDFIIVRFKSGDTYRYGPTLPGEEDVALMQQMARKGEGLSTYISQRVKDRFEEKLV